MVPPEIKDIEKPSMLESKVSPLPESYYDPLKQVLVIPPPVENIPKVIFGDPIDKAVENFT